MAAGEDDHVKTGDSYVVDGFIGNYADFVCADNLAWPQAGKHNTNLSPAQYVHQGQSLDLLKTVGKRN